MVFYEPTNLGSHVRMSKLDAINMYCNFRSLLNIDIKQMD